MVEAINQAECTECDSDSEIRQTDRTYNMTGSDETWIRREVRCRGCGATGAVTISSDGVSAEGDVTHENASWN